MQRGTACDDSFGCQNCLSTTWMHLVHWLLIKKQCCFIKTKTVNVYENIFCILWRVSGTSVDLVLQLIDYRYFQLLTAELMQYTTRYQCDNCGQHHSLYLLYYKHSLHYGQAYTQCTVVTTSNLLSQGQQTISRNEPDALYNYMCCTMHYRTEMS